MTNWTEEGHNRILAALERGKLTRKQNFENKVVSHNQRGNGRKRRHKRL